MKKIEAENATLNEEVKVMKVEFNTMIDKAKIEAMKIHQDAVDVGTQKTNEIIAEARKKAREIIDRTEKEMVEEKIKLESEIRAEISIVSLDVAEKIIEREIKEQDNDKLIEECLNNWSSNE